MTAAWPAAQPAASTSAARETERPAFKDKFGRRLGGAVLALTDDPQSTRAWATGARGEEKFAAALNGIDGLRVLHDRRVPNSRANIDHIVIAPAGVFVVDAKNYRGTIAIRNRGWFFRPDHRLFVGRRDCSALATGLGWQVEAVTVALAAAGVDPLPPVTPVLCFIDGEWPLFSAPDEYAGADLRERGPSANSWPRRRFSRANIDHIAIGPPGVFVIESKDYSGRVWLGSNEIRVNGRRG